MSSARVAADGFSSNDSRVLEAVERFEDAWQTGQAPDLDRFCPPPGDPQRLALLTALVQVDLERRLKAGEPARLEGYLQRYPELAAVPDCVVDLLATEYEQRRRRGPEPDLAEYDRRWPQRADALR